MAKSVHDDVLDAALKYIKTNCNAIRACSTQPTTYAQANNLPSASGYRLAGYTAASTMFVVATGTTSGRKVTVSATNGITVEYSGTYAHVALLDTTASKLLYVTTGTSQGLTAANTVNFPAWKIEIADPT